MQKKTILAILFFTISFDAHAYIEPGVITMFLQAVIAAVVGCVMYLTFYWQKFKNFLKKILIKSNNKNKN